MRVVVIGAGIAGCTAAAELAAAGHAVTVIDKSRGTGGRMASRRLAAGSVDHGCIAFRAPDPAFHAAVVNWQAAGVVVPWEPRSVRLTAGGTAASDPQGDRWIGLPRMSALTRHLLGDLPLLSGTRIMNVERTQSLWSCRDRHDVVVAEGDALVLAVPAPQAAELLASSRPDLAAAIGAARVDPAWSAVVATEADPDWDEAFCDHSVVQRLVRNASRPGRSDRTWTIQTQPTWSRSTVDADHADAWQAIAAALADLAPFLAVPDPLLIHRWRYGHVTRPLAVDCLGDADDGLIACGDWCRDGNTSGAWLSARAAAARLI